MELTKCKLGELITQRREKNDGSDLPICGVSKDGLIPPKQKDADTSIYNVFYRDDFIFNPARMELNSIAINDMYDRAICSSLYEVFYVHRTDLLLPHYLELIIRQKWFTRYCEFLGQGSAREYCRFGNISEIEIEFPPIEEQQKIVEYNTAIENRIALKQKINDNLAATIQTIFLSCKQSDTFKTYLPLNELVKTVNFRNKDNVYGIDDLMGVSLTKEFIKSPANTISLDVSNYKIVKPFQFACNLMHVGRDKKVAVGMLTDADNVIISPAFTVFETINNNVILPEVLVSWFSQSFFDNEVSYLASEGIRDGIKWDTFAQIPIFIPEFEIQTKIQNIYKNIQQNKLEISTLNNFADTFITTLSSC